MSRQYLQGKYRPLNPQKYVGDTNDIVYRSSWELAAFKFCDNEPRIIQWGSEELVIPYRCATDGRMHRYFVDLWVVVRHPDGSRKKFIVEIKPAAQLNKPRKTEKKKEETYLRECLTWAKNQSKWVAARKWAEDNDSAFLIWTEKELVPQSLSYKKATKK